MKTRAGAHGSRTQARVLIHLKGQKGTQRKQSGFPGFVLFRVLGGLVKLEH